MLSNLKLIVMKNKKLKKVKMNIVQLVLQEIRLRTKINRSIKKIQILKGNKNSLNIIKKTLQKINNKIIINECNNKCINLMNKTIKFKFWSFYKHIIY